MLRLLPLDKMISWAYRWLPIVFGCHCRPNRSFFFHGRQFPICARCTGELVGILAAIPCIFFCLPPAWIAAVLMVPMVADGLIQLLTRYESRNWLRLVTGILFGYGLFTLFAISVVAVFRFGYYLAT